MLPEEDEIRGPTFSSRLQPCEEVWSLASLAGGSASRCKLLFRTQRALWITLTRDDPVPNVVMPLTWLAHIPEYNKLETRRREL